MPNQDLTLASATAALQSLRESIERRHRGMDGDAQGNGSRCPDGDDYDELYREVTATLDEIAPLSNVSKPVDTITASPATPEQIARRRARIDEEIEGADATLCHEFKMPDEPGRYMVLETSAGVTVWAFICATLQQVATDIAASDTSRDDVLVLDLDADEDDDATLTPCLKVVRIYSRTLGVDFRPTPTTRDEYGANHPAGTTPRPLQLARLCDESRAVLSSEQIAQMAVSMDLQPAEVEALFEQASALFEGAAKPPDPKPHKVRILWGSTSEPGDEPKEYSFTTEAELNAFLEGVDAANGWLDYKQIDPNPDGTWPDPEGDDEEGEEEGEEEDESES